MNEKTDVTDIAREWAREAELSGRRAGLLLGMTVVMHLMRHHGEHDALARIERLVGDLARMDRIARAGSIGEIVEMVEKGEIG